jgi:signal transduction histidine kinase
MPFTLTSDLADHFQPHQIERLSQLEREIVETLEHERSLMAGELHDGLCQRLTTLSMLVATLQSHAAGLADPTCEGLLARIHTLTEQAIRETRALAHNLHASTLGDTGLADALEQLAENVDAAHHIACTFTCPDLVTIPDGERAQHLYRIAQEAVANALRHGHPTHIAIDLARADGDRVVLTVRNDGVPLDPGTFRRGGLGLRSMQRRAQRLGGTFEITPRAGGGAQVRVEAPRIVD